VRMPILRYSAPLFPSNSCIRFAAASVSSMTCFVDLIVDCLAVNDEEDAAACVIARLSIRVVNMERMLSRKDTCSLSFFSAKVVVVVVDVKIPSSCCFTRY